MKLKISLFTIFLLLSIKGYCQQFYVATSQGGLELVTMTANGPTSQTVFGCGGYFSIAIKGSKIYYNTANGVLYSADISGGSQPVLSNCTFIANNVLGNALTIDSQGILYYVAANQLYSIDPKNPLPNYLGDIPYYSGGDLTFFNNELYMAASNGIVKVQISDPSKSTLEIPIPGQFILGLAPITLNGQKKLYALLAGNDNNSTDLLELDMQNKITKGNAGKLYYLAFDSGSVYESGLILTVGVQSIGITQDCDAFNKASVNIVCKPDSSQHTYTLNTGQSDTTGVFNGLAPGTYKVQVASNGVRQPKDTSFTVVDYTLNNPVITITGINPVCDIKGNIKLDAGAANSAYSVKYGNDVFGLGHTFSGLSAGNYHFTILNQKGCIADEKDYTLQQDVCPPIVITSMLIDRECQAFGQGRLTVSTSPHPDNYTYTLNNSTDITGVFGFLNPGSYTLVITSSGGDKVVQQVVIPDYSTDIPLVTNTVTHIKCEIPGAVEFLIQGDAKGVTQVSYGSNVYPLNQSISITSAGVNSFKLLTSQGCIIDTLDVIVPQDECRPVAFPTAFTPNGDSINDLFGPNQDSDPSVFKLSVYDRWGKLIFQSQSIFKRWDGRYNGAPAPSGIYYWVANYATDTGKQQTQSGNVTLIR